MELAFYVSINDLCAAIEICLGILPPDSPACWFQGMGTTYSFLASVFWNCVITYQIFLIVHRGSIIEDMTKFHYVCWFLPLIPMLLPLTTNNYGSDGDSWCFLTNRSNSPPWGIETWELFSFFVWLWACILFIFVVFFRILIRLREIDTVESMSAYRPLYRLGFCPLVLTVCWTLPSFLALHHAINHTTYEGPGTYHIHALATSLPPFQGFLMSFGFFLVNESARDEWWTLIRSGRRRPSPGDSIVQRDTISTMHPSLTSTAVGESSSNTRPPLRNFTISSSSRPSGLSYSDESYWTPLSYSTSTGSRQTSVPRDDL